MRSYYLNRWLGNIVLAAAVTIMLAGCGGHRTPASSGPMYVNVFELASARPEWRGVTRMDQQLAALEAERAALLRQAAPGAAAPPALSIPPPPPLAVPPPTTEEAPPPELDAKVLLASIKNELNREAQREQAAFARKASDRYLSQEFAAKTKQWDHFTNQRRSILDRYNAQVTALVQQERTLNDAISKPDLALVATVTSGSTPAAAQLARVKAAISADLAAQNRELLANFHQLQAALAGVDADFRARAESDIRAQQAKTADDIVRRLNAARVDVEGESAQRSEWFAHGFENPAQRPLPLSLSALTPTAVPAPRSSPSDLAAAIADQEAIISQERTRLASFILADTQDWVTAIAHRENLTIVNKPGANAPDETARFAAWIEQWTIPV